MLSRSVTDLAVIDLINLTVSSKAKIRSIVIHISTVTDIISVLEIVDMVVSNQLQSGASFRIRIVVFINATFLVLNDILLSKYSNNNLRFPNRQPNPRMTGKLTLKMTCQQLKTRNQKRDTER